LWVSIYDRGLEPALLRGHSKVNAERRFCGAAFLLNQHYFFQATLPSRITVRASRITMHSKDSASAVFVKSMHWQNLTVLKASDETLKTRAACITNHAS